MAALRCQRSAYSLPQDEHYLNCAYMAPLSRRIERAAVDALRRLRRPSAIGTRHFFDDVDAARERFARLLSAPDPSRVAIVPSVSYGIAIAARNVPLGPGQSIVVAAGQFPSNVYAWTRLAQRSGAAVRTVARPEEARGRAAEWSARLIEAIDRNTAIVALGTVDWTDGTPFALDAIGARARDVGAAYVLDGIHSIGATPFDVRRVKPDLLVTAAYKWLGGPMGIGLIWVGDRFVNGEPLEETWAGRAGSEDFRTLTDYAGLYRPGAERFDQGGRAQFVLLPMLNAALDQLLGWEPARIANYCERLAAPFLESARTLGLGVDDAPDRCSHIFALRLPKSASAADVQCRLKTGFNVHVSARGESLRVAPFIYNSSDDLTALGSGLRALL